jgi:hypothetical protein
MGLAPLSDPYVAIHLTMDNKKSATDVVKEPEGSVQLPRRSISLQAAVSNPPQLLDPHKIFSKTVPDSKCRPGWQYEIEAAGDSRTSALGIPDKLKGPPGDTDGSRDIIELQVGSKVCMDETRVGRKCMVKHNICEY